MQIHRKFVHCIFGRWRTWSKGKGGTRKYLWFCIHVLVYTPMCNLRTSHTHTHTYSCSGWTSPCRIPGGELWPIRATLHGTLAERTRQHRLSSSSLIHSLPVSQIRQVSSQSHSKPQFEWSHSQTRDGIQNVDLAASSSKIWNKVFNLFNYKFLVIDTNMVAAW